jgi:hypothetical protein
LWNAFKKEWVNLTTQRCNLICRAQPVVDEEMNATLQAPFSDKEIEDVIKKLPNDKFPVPDGFNNEFVKSHRTIIAPDVKSLIRDSTMVLFLWKVLTLLSSPLSQRLTVLQLLEISDQSPY